MPGFGNNQFGNSTFGEWNWRKNVFWDLIPYDVRAPDPDYGGYLQSYLTGISQSFDAVRLLIRNLDSLRDPLLARSQYDDITLIRLGAEIVRPGTLQQQGIDGSVLSLGAFQSQTARFESDDRGKLLVIARSANPKNNQTYTITAVISTKIVITDPLIAVDAGPLQWQVRATESTASGVRTYRVVSGSVDTIVDGWTVNDGRADYPIVGKRRLAEPKGSPYLERYGVDGYINGLGNFQSPIAPFQPSDTGKRLTLRGMPGPINDTVYEIGAVFASDEVVLLSSDGTNPTSLPLTAGPLEWTLLPFAEIDIASPKVPLGSMEQAGIDLVVSGSIATSATAAFSAGDVGKVLQVLNSAAGNDGLYEILTFVTENEVTIDGSLSAEADLLWRLRTQTLIGDGSQVEAYPQSLLALLAQNYAIEIDSQESEVRQRSWVQNVTRWIGKKGTAYAYEFLCAVSGFDADVSALYRITQDLATAIPTAHLFDIRENRSGCNGDDGELTAVSGRVRFSSPTALFVASDIGKQIKIRNAGISTNDKYYTIDSVVSATTVQFRTSDTATLPDPESGSLLWALVRLYTDLAPTIPRYDHANIDLLQAIVSSGTNKTFRVDKYCWQDDWSSDTPVSIIARTQTTSSEYLVTVTHNTGAYASGDIGFGDDGTVTITADVIGIGGNSITVEVVDPSPAPSLPLTVSTLGQDITIQLATTVLGALDSTANTASLVAAAINASAGGFVTATASGTGTFPLSGVETRGNLSGGQDTFLTAPEVVVKVGNWKVIDSSGAEFWLESVPALSSAGPPPEYQFRVSTPTAPALGAATFRYVCDKYLACGYCASSKVRVAAALSSLALESGVATERMWERLSIRLSETTPLHVNLILLFEQELEATIGMTAELVDPGITGFATLYSPFTVYDGEIPIDLYPLDTMLTAEVDAPAPRAIMRGVATAVATGRVV